LLVVGGLAGFAAIQAKHLVDDECDEHMQCSAEGVAAASRGKRLAIVSTSAVALGAAALGAGLWLILKKRDVEPKDDSASLRFRVESDGLKLEF
jgi:hypothetical protein